MNDSARGVLFDMDGTLVDTNCLHAVSRWEAMRQSGRTVPMAGIHRAAGLSTEGALMVGDSVWDVRAAERAGVPCIGLTCGGTSAAELREAGAVETYDDPAALCDKLERSAIAKLIG